VINATQFPGVRLVVITPDVHVGYGVPVGSVILTDIEHGALAMGPVGFDIGCFPAETLVPTADGRSYPISELTEREGEIYVYALSSQQRVAVARATARKTRSGAPLVRVTLDNGRDIVCTPDHLFMLRDGTHQAAATLELGASLMPFSTRADKDGYTVVRHPATQTEQRVHWIIARTRLLGEIPRFVGQKTFIHHRNFIPTDNRPENLEFMGDKDHMRYHRSIPERNTHFQSEEFERRRKQALATKAGTADGRAFVAERGARNILAYMKGNPDHFKRSVVSNGKRGKHYLVAYNASAKGRKKSSEIAHREYVCETCGEVLVGGFGIHNHRRWRHGYNHKVVTVETLERRDDVYCLTVPEYGNFALDAGVFVHNCGMMSARSDVPADRATYE
jgi:tRNA-splicing ligase RtcB